MRHITHLNGAYFYDGRPFEFDVDGPVHPDVACDATVTDARWLDDGPDGVEELIDAIYAELPDVIFERATTP